MPAVFVVSQLGQAEVPSAPLLELLREALVDERNLDSPVFPAPLVVKEDTQTIAPTGPATSEFHVSKPDGWPVGECEVEVFANDKSAGVKKFSVK